VTIPGALSEEDIISTRGISGAKRMVEAKSERVQEIQQA
jgi:hypothetical protein